MLCPPYDTLHVSMLIVAVHQRVGQNGADGVSRIVIAAWFGLAVHAASYGSLELVGHPALWLCTTQIGSTDRTLALPAANYLRPAYLIVG